MVQQAGMDGAAPLVGHRVRDLRSEVDDPQVVEKASILDLIHRPIVVRSSQPVTTGYREYLRFNVE
jgi:hypothetical protein